MKDNMQILIRYRHGRLNDVALLCASNAPVSLKFAVQDGQCACGSNDAAEGAARVPRGKEGWRSFCRKLIEASEIATRDGGGVSPKCFAISA
jgi:hypothetical protein